MSLIDNFFLRNQNSIIWLAITKNIFQKKKKDIIEKRKRRLVVKKRDFFKWSVRSRCLFLFLKKNANKTKRNERVKKNL